MDQANTYYEGVACVLGQEGQKAQADLEESRHGR